jgi:hypothetical protein
MLSVAQTIIAWNNSLNHVYYSLATFTKICDAELHVSVLIHYHQVRFVCYTQVIAIFMLIFYERNGV